MTSLSDRVEAATADQQREMLEQAYQACNGGKLYGLPGTEGFRESYARWQRFRFMLGAEAYESAAMMLLPKGSGYTLRNPGGRIRPSAAVYTDFITNATEGSASAPALALTAASLRARGL